MPLINRCGGGGGIPQLCAQVENFKVRPTSSASTVHLSWSAPNDDSYVGVRIVRKVGSAPYHRNDGVVVYEGDALNYIDSGLTEGTTYYFRAFAYNSKKQYQTAMSIDNITAFAVSDTFSANSWDTIIAVCQSGSVPSAWSVGDSKTMTIDGASRQIDIIGKNHDTYEDGGTAPLTFQLHDYWLTVDKPGAVVNYDDHLSIMPLNVQNAIRNVIKLQKYADAPMLTIPMKLFLLSEYEVNGGSSSRLYQDGSQYAYYSAGNSKIKKDANGKAGFWWLRTLNGSSQSYIDDYGKSQERSGAYPNGIAFAFCF